jgi:2-methylisocitrate lyase-like PEP mutase family enzyme
MRRLLAQDLVIAPGASDAWTARLIEDAGFAAAYMTGGGLANALLGVPDVGLTTLTEVISQAARMADAVRIPLIVDADTGFGGVASIQRTVRELERAGVAGLHIEDQVAPKRCGHFDGKAVVSTEDMVLRLHAALDARRDSDFMIIARTDARAVEGLDSAIERAHTYASLGIDGVFIEALLSAEEFETVGREFPQLPLIANMVEGGKSPLIPVAELRQMGFNLVIYANFVLRIGAFAVRRGLKILRETGTTASLLDEMLTWEERQALVGMPDLANMEERVSERTLLTMNGRAIAKGVGDSGLSSS